MSNLKYNGTDINELIYNGQRISSLRYNGVTVFPDQYTAHRYLDKRSYVRISISASNAKAQCEIVIRVTNTDSSVQLYTMQVAPNRFSYVEIPLNNHTFIFQPPGGFEETAYTLDGYILLQLTQHQFPFNSIGYITIDS